MGKEKPPNQTKNTWRCDIHIKAAHHSVRGHKRLKKSLNRHKGRGRHDFPLLPFFPVLQVSWNKRRQGPYPLVHVNCGYRGITAVRACLPQTNMPTAATALIFYWPYVCCVCVTVSACMSVCACRFVSLGTFKYSVERVCVLTPYQQRLEYS